MDDWAAARTFIYQVDALNRLTFLNQDWLDFARENQAPELIPETVLGRDLDRFIADWETRHLYEIIYLKVRDSGREVHLPFRCDSPEWRRFFRMTIAPLPLRGLEFSVKVLKIEPRPPLPAFKNTLEPSSVCAVICSWCKRIEINEGRWLDVERASEEKDLFGDSTPALTHGVCPNCLASIRHELEGH